MSKERPWIITRYINDVHIVSIDIDRFVTDNQFLKLFAGISHYSDVSISNVKLIFVLKKETMLQRLILVEFNEKNTKLFLVFVC